MPAVGARTRLLVDSCVLIYYICSTDKCFCVIQSVKNGEAGSDRRRGGGIKPRAVEQVELFQVEIGAGEIKHIATARCSCISLGSLPSHLNGLIKHAAWQYAAAGLRPSAAVTLRDTQRQVRPAAAVHEGFSSPPGRMTVSPLATLKPLHLLPSEARPH